MAPGSKEAEIMDFLQERVFEPVLRSPTVSERLKQGVRLTIARMNQRDAAGMIHYFWSGWWALSAAQASPPRCDEKASTGSKKRSRR